MRPAEPAKTIFADNKDPSRAICLVEYSNGDVGIVRGGQPIGSRWDVRELTSCVDEYLRLTAASRGVLDSAAGPAERRGQVRGETSVFAREADAESATVRASIRAADRVKRSWKPRVAHDTKP